MFIGSHQTVHTAGGAAAPTARWAAGGRYVSLDLARDGHTTVGIYGPEDEVRDLLSAALAALDRLPASAEVA